MPTDAPFTPPKKKPHVGWWIAGFFLLLFMLFLYQLVGPSPRIDVSKQTTYVTEPLLENGLPDYEAYLRAKMSEGVTPENNAAVLLLKALGPGDVSRADFDAVAAEIGLDPTSSDVGALESLHSDANRQRVLAWLPKPAPAADGMESKPDVEAHIEVAQRTAWTSQQLPPLAEWVEANQAPLDLIVEATRRPRYYCPSPSLLNNTPEMMFSMQMVGIQSYRDGARGLAARAHWHVGEGRLEEAWQDNLALYRLSALIAQGPTLIDQLVGMAIRGMAVHTTSVLLSSDQVTKEVAQRIQQDLAAIAPLTGTANTVDQGERIFGLNSTIHVRAHGLGAISQLSGAEGEPSKLSLISLDWNVVLRDLNRAYDQAAAAMRVTDYEERKTAFVLLEAELNGLRGNVRKPGRLFQAAFSRHARSEIVGNLFTALLLPALTAANAAEDRTNSQLSLAQISAALAIYRAEHGAYPKKLDDLVPGILPTLPVDLLHAKPFMYRRTENGFLLYSVGANGTDDGGSNEQMRILEGRSLDNVDENEAAAIDEKIPANADDYAIRLPVPLFKLPKPFVTDLQSSQ
jgi:hypothetical protein